MTTSFTAPRLGVEDLKAAFDALPEEERQAIYRDIYGKTKHKREDPKEIQKQLIELDEALERTPDSQKEHFLRAQELCPEIANDRAFRLRFLRADYYNIKDAAKRTLKYWKAREEVFGRERAYQKLVLSSFEENDFSVPKHGGFHVLPKKDKAGRCIYFCMKQKWIYPDRKNFLRWFWYVTEAALEDEGIQTAGAVVVAFDDGPFSLSNFDRKLESKLYKIGEQCFPIRGIAVHHCYDSKMYEFVIPFILFLFGKNLRRRYRIYPGRKSHLRMDQFEEMGISREILPRMMGGLSDFDVMEWIEERKKAGK